MVYYMTVIIDHILIIIYFIIGSYSKGKGSPNQGSARVVAKQRQSAALHHAVPKSYTLILKALKRTQASTATL